MCQRKTGLILNVRQSKNLQANFLTSNIETQITFPFENNINQLLTLKLAGYSAPQDF